jgi:hypothetical protein
MSGFKMDTAGKITTKRQQVETGSAGPRLALASFRDTHDRAIEAARSASGGCARGDEPLPIWLAVLMATACQARGSGGYHDVQWNCVSGRAVYTNFGRESERIEPLGVSLSGGETLAVYWTPGETAYTMEVYSQAGKCA